MSPIVGAAVCCLALRFEWNGQELKAGRRPYYGFEVPNVRPASTRAAAARPSVLYPFASAPLRFLADMTAAGQAAQVVLDPPPPPAAGTLKVRLSLGPCGEPALASDPRLRLDPQLLAFRVAALRPVTEGPGAGSESAELARGELAEGAPLDLVLDFPKAPGAEERIDVVLRSRADPELAVRMTWSRLPHARREEASWQEAPPPHGATPSRR